MSAALLPRDDTTTRRIAIVEDEGILALDIERYLRARGFDVTGVASDASSAIALVDSTQPDLVLMDIRIQGELDGIETAAVLRERFDVPVVYLTAHSDPATMDRARRTNPLGYLLKPFKKPDLENVVTIALQRNELEGRLRRRETLLATTLRSIDEAVVTANDQAVVTYANNAARALTGASDEQLVHRPLAEVIRLRDRTGTQLPFTPSLQAERIDAMLDTSTGARAVVGTYAPLMEGATSFGSVVALRDLTELLEARRQVEFSERLASLGALAAGVAHEVNNPLSVVLANLQFALSDPMSRGEYRQVLNEARDSATRVAHIVRDLHTMARPQVETLEPMSPLTSLAAALSLSRVRWRPVVPVGLRLSAVPWVLGATTRLTQVLVNLLGNAVHALQSIPQAERQLEVNVELGPGGTVTIAVLDSGCGVSPEAQCRLFEPFFTTKSRSEGTGMGLAVSRNIARSHGGDLRYEPRADARGSRFVLTLPTTQQRPGLPPPLRVLWVGARMAALDALEASGVAVLQRTPDDPRLREVAAQFQPTAVLGNCEAQRRLQRVHGALEAISLAAGDDSEPGVLSLRMPFEVHALAWLAARDGT